MRGRLAIFDYLNTSGWVPLEDAENQISLLSRSETNTNYLVTAHELYGNTQFVFRVNTDSRLGLTDQAEYEFTVLQALRRSGVTPRPFYCKHDSVFDQESGVMLMEYLAGRPLHYCADWESVAKTLAAVHSQPVDGRLLVHETPLADVVRECAGLSDYFEHPRLEAIRRGYESCLEDMLAIATAVEDVVVGESPVITHGTLSASDFILCKDTGKAWLIDWENGCVASRYRDLGQFMANASRAGELGFCRNDAERKQFLQTYFEALDSDMDLDGAFQRAFLFEQAAELRAMIWNCVALTGPYGGKR